jgi:hypothetical protein
MLPFDSSLFPGSLKLLIPFFEDVFILAVQFVRRGDVADGAVKPNAIVTSDVLCHKSPGIVKRKEQLGDVDAFSAKDLTSEYQPRGRESGETVVGLMLCTKCVNVPKVSSKVSELKFDKNNPQQLYAVLIYVRIMELISSVLHSIDGKTFVAVPILIRGIFEAQVDLINIIPIL